MKGRGKLDEDEFKKTQNSRSNREDGEIFSQILRLNFFSEKVLGSASDRVYAKLTESTSACSFPF